MIFAETLETVARNIAMVRPTLMTGVPRVYEKLHARIMAKGQEGSAVTRAVFAWACRVADAKACAFVAGRRRPSGWRGKSAWRTGWCFRRFVRDLGGRFRFAVSGSAPLAQTMGRFFYGIGLPLIEGYGLTETSPVLTAMPLEAIRFGTVGIPLSNVELKIAADGEILGARAQRDVRVLPAARGYGPPRSGTGWFYTGDIGHWTNHGYLKITDRKKELLCTSGGKKIAPQPIENALRANRLIAEAVLIGDNRHFPTALLVPDFAALADRLGVARPRRCGRDRGPRRTAGHPRCLRGGRRGRQREARCSMSGIKKFHVLPRELTFDRPAN
jgi:long-chain acyl-CoA synthetase